MGSFDAINLFSMLKCSSTLLLIGSGLIMQKNLVKGLYKLSINLKVLCTILVVATPPVECGGGKKHRHLLETVKSLSFQSKLPDSYWGECVLCACYLINRMPLKNINEMTPYQKLYNEPHLLDNLRVFDCLCYVNTIKSHRSKFDPGSLPCAFISYPPHQNAYKVLDLINKKIIMSGDVVFHEHHFPYHILTQESTTHNVYKSSIFLPNITSTNTTTLFDISEFFPTSAGDTNAFDSSSDSTVSSHVPSPNFTTSSTSFTDHDASVTNPIVVRQSNGIRKVPS